MPAEPEDLRDLFRAPGMVVVVPEHRDDGQLEVATRVREHPGLVGAPVCRQIAGQQDEVGATRERAKRPGDALPERLCAVEVAGGSDANRRRHGERDTRLSGCGNACPGIKAPMASTPASKEITELVDTMKRAAAALRDAGIPFMLGGGLAAWARGGPRPTTTSTSSCRSRTRSARSRRSSKPGCEAEQPPEEWLLKAYDGDVLVDLVFHPSGGAIGPEHFARATEMEVLGQKLLVASVDDVLVTKLLSLTEQEPDFRTSSPSHGRSVSRSTGPTCGSGRATPLRARVPRARRRPRYRPGRGGYGGASLRADRSARMTSPSPMYALQNRS